MPSPAPPPRRAAASRDATILFADILGFSELARQRGPDEAFAIVTRCLRRLDEIARRHGGAIDKYLGDCLMAVFGFPVASEQAEREALTAALAMRQAVHDTRAGLELGPHFDLRIGVNTGPILAGEVGGEVIREFAVMGDAVNLAARLKAAAPPGSIRVGPLTRERAGPGFRFQALPETRVKGRQERVRPFVLTGADSAQRRVGESAAIFCEFIGREGELAVLESALAAHHDGSGGVVWIEGADGAGKSRLIAEFAARHPNVHFEERPLVGFASRDAPGPGAAPHVLVLEDAHLASASAIEQMRAWLPLVPALPVLVIVAGHPAPGLAAAHARAEQLGDRYRALSLGPFDAAATERLMDALSVDDPIDAATRALVAKRAAGNPALVIQGVFLADALRADAARAESHRERSDEAERRRTTVLFADLTGFTALAERSDPHVLHELVTSCLDELSTIARRHGGSVEKHLGDCILAVFGAPVAIEDAPRAAVNAAIEMRERVAAFNQERGVDPPLRIHTGIDTGLGIAGDVSGPVIREFTLMGESVANASRLMDEAPPGEIFVGDETQRTAREWFDFARAGDAAHALRSRETRLHREVGRRRRVSSDLVGREDELRVLREAVASLKAGRGGVIAVVGDAGLGKTRLVQELLNEIRDDVPWFMGRSLSVGRSLSFHPFADLLSRWCGIDDDDDQARAAEKLASSCEALLGDAADGARPFLATLMGLPLRASDRARLDQIEGDAMQRLILGAVTRVLREGAALQPLVIVFEDLHWADLSSLELLESLLRLPEEEPILLVAMLRSRYEETGERFRTAATERLGTRYRELLIEPLGPDLALAMLRNLFRGGDVPPTLLAAVRERARGNPFYVEEVVRSLLDTGALAERDGRLEATARISQVKIPGTLNEVVMARVDALDRERRELLRAASAIGGSFHPDVLAEVVGKDNLAERLESLVEAELLEPRSRTGELRFKHPLIQEVVYDSLVAERREALHRAIGAAIETHVAPSAPGYHAQLAFHYSRARDLERAEAHLFRAGDEAARSAASDEALDFFREASALYVTRHGRSGDPAKLALLERNIARALANRGRYVEAIRHFDAALRHHGVPVTNNRLLLGVRLARDLAVVLGRLYLPGARRPRPPASEQQRAVQELIYDRARAQTTSAMGRYLFDWLDGLRRLESADPKTMPLAGGQLASTVGIFSYGGVSFAVSARFLALARDVVRPDDPTERVIYGFMNYFHHVLAGDWDDAHELPDDLVEDRIRNGQLFDITNYLAFCAEKRIYQGRFEEALHVMTKLREIEDLYQYDLAASSLHGLTAFLHSEQESWDEAVRAADLHYTEHDDPLLNLLALGTKAKAQVMAGDPDGAAHSLATAERLLARAQGVVPPYQKSAVLRSRFLLELHQLEQGSGSAGDTRRAARAARNACAMVACRRPEVFRLEARRRCFAGDKRGAARWWERAVSEAERLGMTPELARIEAERSARRSS